MTSTLDQLIVIRITIVGRGTTKIGIQKVTAVNQTITAGTLTKTDRTTTVTVGGDQITPSETQMAVEENKNLSNGSILIMSSENQLITETQKVAVETWITIEDQGLTILSENQLTTTTGTLR